MAARGTESRLCAQGLQAEGRAGTSRAEGDTSAGEIPFANSRGRGRVGATSFGGICKYCRISC